MNQRRVLTGMLAGLLAFGLAGSGLAEWKEETKGGKVIRREWVDDSGAAALSPEGYAAVNLTYNGTTVTEKYYDLHGEPVEILGGYYGRSLTYGNKHRLEEIIYLDADGSKTDCAAGYARLKIVHTAAGGVTQATYYDMYGSMVKVPSLGYAQVKNDYRGTTLTKTTYLDENKNPVDTVLGYAVMIQSVNKSNRVTGIRFEHADGSAAAGPEGWAVMKRELDKKNREASVKYYDLSGQIVDRGLGYAYETKQWENDQVCVISRYDLSDQQVPMGTGYVSLRREMNKDGQVIRETFLDASGSVTESAEGIAARKYEYDENGRLAKVTFEGTRGEAKECNVGYAGYQEIQDADGFTLSRTFVSLGGSPVNSTAGYSEIRYRYDGNHQITATEYYDVSGVLVKTE